MSYLGELALFGLTSLVLSACGSEGAPNASQVSLTSASETSDEALSSAAGTSATGTTQETTTTGGLLVLTSPSLEGSGECSDANLGACKVFLDENISYKESPNISPELAWKGVPMGTKSFAITLKDVTFGQPLWAIWNIPGDAVGLPAALEQDSATLTVPAGAEQSNASFVDGDGYCGPEAPCNVFQFELFALSIERFDPSYKEYAAEVDAQLNQLGATVLGRTTLAGRTNYAMMCE
jgi:Raf kinase inhibitor-like YbhB/YbcL family protein